MNRIRAFLGAPPLKQHRVVFAAIVSVYGAFIAYTRYWIFPEHAADFAPVWFGARALLHNANPYALVGPGRVFEWGWGLYYPVPALIIAMPFALLPQLSAVLLFVAVSSALLAYAATSDGWYRLPLFLCVPFVVAAATAQWSILFTAALLIPPLGVLYAAKPNLGLALGLGGGNEVAKFAALGGIVLVALSLALLPHWPLLWIRALETADHVRPPLSRMGGVFILLAALRWRRPEARLILALAFVPQTSAWYEMLPLFLVPRTFRQMLYFAAGVSVGSLMEQHVIRMGSEIEYGRNLGALMVAVGFLPATVLVLRRPNIGELPRWTDFIKRAALRQTDSRERSSGAYES